MRGRLTTGNFIRTNLVTIGNPLARLQVCCLPLLLACQLLWYCCLLLWYCCLLLLACLFAPLDCATAACKLNAVSMCVLRVQMQQEGSTPTDLFLGDSQLVSVHIVKKWLNSCWLVTSLDSYVQIIITKLSEPCNNFIVQCVIFVVVGDFRSRSHLMNDNGNMWAYVRQMCEWSCVVWIRLWNYEFHFVR